MRFRTGVITPRNCTLSDKKLGIGTFFGFAEIKRRAAFCNKVAKAKEVIKTAVTDFSLTGLKAT